MSDDVLERTEAMLADAEPFNEEERLIRDLAAEVRAGRVEVARLDKRIVALHERAEKAEAALAEARADADAMEANYEALNDLRCELENRLYPAERALAKVRGLLERCVLLLPQKAYALIEETRAFLAAHPAPAECECLLKGRCGHPRTDPRPAPAECASCEELARGLRILLNATEELDADGPEAYYSSIESARNAVGNYEKQKARADPSPAPTCKHGVPLSGGLCQFCLGIAPEPPSPRCTCPRLPIEQFKPGHEPGCPAAKREGK